MQRTALLLASCAAAWASAPAAGAAEKGTLRAGDAVPRLCHARALEGSRGVATHRWTAPAGGLVTVKLEGTRFSDWDLAVFGPEGERLGASTAFGAAEQALLRAKAGDELLVQACRRLGADHEVPFSIDLFETGPVKSAEPAQLVEVPVDGRADFVRLEATGLDVTHDHHTGGLSGAGRAKVVVYSAAERARLERAGFPATTLIADMAAADLADRRLEARAPAVAARALPSGRTNYRQPQDYTTDMKTLAEENPDLVRKLTLPLPTLEGRPIEGIEIATGVNRTDDGRPVYLQMGLHHAREWPSGELPMEFAIDLVKRFRAGDVRVAAVLDKVRVVVVPVVNVDGFVVSRGAGQSPADEDSNATLPLALNDQAAYKRKNCRPTVPGSEALPCAMRSNSGVDLNRNYGAYWGGPGSSDNVATQSYRGTGPFSEPESEAVHRFTAALHVVTFITNHTFTEDGKFLRQPGFNAQFLPDEDEHGNKVTPDEAGMKALGDAMGAATGWTSELGYETLGDITGATEDWNYFSQGTFGYTPEARGPNFHANYQGNVIDEYTGEGDLAGKGVAEAFLVAAEQAANARDHALIEGRAGAGRTLRLKKQFTTATSIEGLVVEDTLDTTTTVPADGTYEWHVNQSKRPLFASSAEVWTMTCEDTAGNVLARAAVTVARGGRARQDLGCPAAGSPPGRPGAPPAAAGCDRPTGRVSAKAVGRARLGRKRAAIRRAFAGGERLRATMDRFCLADGGTLRAGYPSAALRRTLRKSDRRRVRGRAVLLLTTSRSFSVRGIRAGDSLVALRRRIGRRRGVRVGANNWYLARGSRSRLVFKVRGGRVREVGIADARITRGRARAKRFLNSFR